MRLEVFDEALMTWTREGRPGLHHELGAHALLVELDALADDVLVAAPVAEVLAAQARYELRQPVARHRVRHYRRAGVLPAIICSAVSVAQFCWCTRLLPLAS